MLHPLQKYVVSLMNLRQRIRIQHSGTRVSTSRPVLRKSCQLTSVFAGRPAGRPSYRVSLAEREDTAPNIDSTLAIPCKR